MLRCFDDSVDASLVDRGSFVCGHKLMGHPALSLESLCRVLPRLPPGQVMYATRRLATEDNFEKTFKQRPLDRSVAETIETIRESDSYIMVNSPQVDESFADIYQDLIHDVQALMWERGVGDKAISPKLYLFIASPNSVTPFHIDRYSTFLMQFRGSKWVTVSDPWDERVVTSPDRENYVSYVSTQLPWTPEKDGVSTRYWFEPGQALHIPFVAGHHVHNGPDDVSISMSIIFNTPQTVDWRDALNFNQRARKVLRRVGLGPGPVGVNPERDATKAKLWRTWAGWRGY
ncbi:MULTISPECIES: cupin-like domain-containing protein [Hydrogenophaga]|uniref:Transcription factor jumonji jmjc domain-containing protein n=1 Tax=Hydrogenophaga intermedia TaxID=65786 RepID=A0A1L1PMI8_HYDIT|nr:MULTISPECIES: cupin-like domain-containing protein [Hydrogenophaga]AOS79353.1 transcriptional regulator [Hydrogenophaga sp. PBC]TMU72833.1 transcriptional regulator [Hydrogenophaga intermedia]CDN88939.1 Transcription factor jumonji jmjc domain-containing protein [Hydrogenophaga intermedia]